MALKVDTERINLSSCPDQLIPGPCLALLFSLCSSPLAEQCMLPAVSASAVKTDHICHEETLARRWEKSITSSHCSSLKTQLNKPAVQLQEQFPLRAEFTLANEFPSWLLAHSCQCINNKSSQWTKYNPGKMKLQVATETIWQSFCMTTFLPSSTHLAVYTNSGLQVGPYSCQHTSPAGKLHGIKEGETLLTVSSTDSDKLYGWPKGECSSKPKEGKVLALSNDIFRTYSLY